ncbi:MAG: TRAP transporter small permease [Spirochaetota bacterium]
MNQNKKKNASPLKKAQTGIAITAHALKWISAVSVVSMMLLTCADVILRLFRRPIPGTYELVGFLGAMFVSFSLAYTSVMRFHISVEFLYRKLAAGTRKIVEVINSTVPGILFGFITWHCFAYAMDMKKAGEISLTLQVPIYPFVLGVAAGCGILCAVLLFRALETFANS